MDMLDEFCLMLVNTDKAVFGRMSQICRTASKFEKYTGLRNPVMYFPEKITLIKDYPNIKTDYLIPDNDFFLIQTRMFDGRVRVCKKKRGEEMLQQLFFEMVVKRMIVKLTLIQQVRWGSWEKVLEHGLLSCQQIFNFVDIPDLTLEWLEEEFSEVFDEHIQTFYEFSDIDPEFRSYRATTETLGAIIYICVGTTCKLKGHAAGIALLKRLVQAFPVPKR